MTKATRPQFSEFKSRFREMTLAAYQAHCDRIAEECAGIQDDSELRGGALKDSPVVQVSAGFRV